MRSLSSWTCSGPISTRARLNRPSTNSGAATGALAERRPIPPPEAHSEAAHPKHKDGERKARERKDRERKDRERKDWERKDWSDLGVRVISSLVLAPAGVAAAWF